MNTLPEPNFIDRNPEIVTSQLIETFETKTGRTLYPAQVERLIIDLIAYRETLIRIAIQEAAKQNLLAYARYPMIDYLGELLNVTRLEAQPAVCTLEFTLEEAQEFDVTIPSGTRVETKDGEYIFTTDEEVVIPGGETTPVTSVEVTATCSETGSGANGYLAGEVNSLVDPVAYIDTVENTDETSGGAAQESDDAFRERIKLAPEAFSNAGSKGAYEFHAKSASAAITDVAVSSAIPGEVDVYILTEDGLPSEEILDLVDEALNDESVRPLTDTVNVLAPSSVNFTIVATVTPYDTADLETMQTAIEEALDDYIETMKAELGKDIVPSQITTILGTISGVYMVELTSPVYDELSDGEWANCTGYTITYEEAVNG